MANIFVFAFDLSEASQIRRIQSLQKLGHVVHSASFDRRNMNFDFQPDWPNVDLGKATNEQYGKRILGLFSGLWQMLRNQAAVTKSDVIIARNFDLLVLAWATRLILNRRDIPLVYECLDIHRLFTKDGTIGAVMRWAERRVLRSIQLLVVSSPGFVTSYFKPTQGYDGPVSILENKLWFEVEPIARPSEPRRSNRKKPLSVGWVGSIRCAPSLKILMETADQLGAAVEINIHGNIHHHALPDFDREVAARSNVFYHGPYSYPADLADVYGNCDVVWAQDLWQRGANSDWLLPNRIYEAGWFGCPCIAVSDSQTGRRIAEDQLGFTIPKPDADHLCQLLNSVSRDELARVSDQILEMPDARFLLDRKDVANALAPVLPNDISRVTSEKTRFSAMQQKSVK